ncbi:MAG TPA: DNA primase [Burkholderiaceae bacterium]|nr:DNA primase [Burkholderiaceae bacterium]
MIPPSFKQDLLARADIVEIVGRYVTLKKAGINFKGLCPFHGEKTPSFIVSPSRQTYHCFGCGAHGNAIDFLMEHSGLGFVEAVEELAHQYGLQVPQDERTPEQRAEAEQARQKQTTLTEALDRAARHYRQQLKGSARAIDYLKGRGLTGEVAARFGLGYAPAGWHGLAGVFGRYDDPVLEEAGLVIAQGEDGQTRRYDRFRDRVMFPIRNLKGEVIGFGGRVVDQGEPKYLNSPETPVFVKGRELYGLYEARGALRAKGYALVVEGYMDVVALAQHGFENAVATLGTACTAEHVQKLFRFTDAVVFSFDGDAAGRKAAARALEACLPHATDTRSVRFLFLPPEHDPDSYIREHGAAAFEQQVQEAVPLSLQLIEQASEGCDLSTLEGRSHMLAAARPLWAQLPDGALKCQLVGAIASRAGLPVEEVLGLWDAPAMPPRRRPASAPPTPMESTARPRPAPGGARRKHPPATPADWAARTLLEHTGWWEHLSAEDHRLLGELPDPHGALFRWIEQQVIEHGPQPWSVVRETLPGQPFEALARRLVEETLGSEQPTEELQRVELRILLDKMHLAADQEESRRLASTPGSLAAYAQVLERIRARQRQLEDLQRALSPSR